MWIYLTSWDLKDSEAWKASVLWGQIQAGEVTVPEDVSLGGIQPLRFVLEGWKRWTPVPTPLYTEWITGQIQTRSAGVIYPDDLASEDMVRWGSRAPAKLVLNEGDRRLDRAEISLDLTLEAPWRYRVSASRA